MNHTVDITPEGLKTEEGQERVKAALQAKDEATDEILRRTRYLLEVMAWKNGRDQIAGILGEYHGFYPEDADATFIAPLLEAIEEWDKVNDEFLKAVAGGAR